jgi:starvation-inducible DNA-binding protein
MSTSTDHSPGLQTGELVLTGFRASERLTANLQSLLIDLTELALQGKQAHWNLVGKNFRDIHLQLDEIIELARGYGDDVAERMRALDVVPDGRTTVVVDTTSLPGFPAGEISVAHAVDLMTDRLYRTAIQARAVHDEVDREDPTTADLLHDIIMSLEKQAWMLKSENRSI